MNEMSQVKLHMIILGLVSKLSLLWYLKEIFMKIFFLLEILIGKSENVIFPAQKRKLKILLWQ
jgi:hypothetical protein